LLLVLSALARPSGAGHSARPAHYAVRRGDNLTVIARRYGTTISALRSENHLRTDVLSIGQNLRILHPFSQHEAHKPVWGPVVKHPGPVLRPYGSYKAGGILMRRTGVELAAGMGSPLYSPADGVIRFSGTVEGLGHTLIIEHAARYSTVLAPCDPGRLLVKVGQAVARGELLGPTGAPERHASKPYAHLELRRDESTVSPRRLYP